MSLAQDTARKAKEIRDRLRSPPNSVVDNGINLRPPKRPQAAEPQKRIEPLARFQKPNPCKPPVIHRKIEAEKPKITIPMIIHAVADHYLIPLQDLMGDCRMRYLSHPRLVAYYLASKHCGLSSGQIGLRLGRDHSTVIVGRQKIGRRIDASPEMRRTIRIIESYLSDGSYG